MYKCLECGRVFNEDEFATWEETHGFSDGRYEFFSGCPSCHGNAEEAERCNQCGEYHFKEELFDGWCESCLIEQIDYDTFFEYCEAHKDENYLDLFVMSYMLSMKCPNYISVEFHQLMIETYKQKVEFAKFTNYHFLKSCIRFIMEDDGDIGKDTFAYWLNKREVK